MPPATQIPPSTPIDFDAAIRRVLNEELLPLERDTNTKTTEIHAEVRTFAQQLGTVSMWLGKYVAPAIGAWVLAKQMNQPPAAVAK